MASPETTESSKKDPGTEPEAAMVDVPHIENEALVPRKGIAAIDLRPASNSRPYFVTTHLLRRLAVEVLREQRAWSYKTHLSADHVPYLRQFIQTGSP